MFVAGSASRLWVDDPSPDAASLSGVPVLLLAPADMPGAFWPDFVLDWFGALGSPVVRFDQRDTGRSSVVSNDYSLRDLAADAIAVLDTLGHEQAHVLGLSMGGMVAQDLALTYPERVHSMTLVATTPGLGDERLPGPSNEMVQALAQRLYAGPPSDRDKIVDWLVAGRELFAGPRFGHLGAAVAESVRAVVDAGWRPDTGHGVAVVSSPSRLDRLGEIAAPTVVVHGTADPVFAIEHAFALADGIPDAELVLVEGLGHEFPGELIEAIGGPLQRVLGVDAK